MSINFADVPILETDRVRLRSWGKEDLDAYIAMGADREVMKYFPGLLSRQEAIGHVADLQERWRNWGFGYWAIETREIPFAGWVGLSRPNLDAHFSPCVEIGWRLAKAAWGKGIASEGAQLALQFGFQIKKISEIVAMVSVENRPSCRVAERIGMTRTPKDDFTYPSKNPWPYQACVLYRIASVNFSPQTA